MHWIEDSYVIQNYTNKKTEFKYSIYTAGIPT